jgi:endonuclease G, mitochondrial
VNAANTILKHDKLFEEFYLASKSLNWNGNAPPNAGHSSADLKDLLKNIVKLKGYSPLNIDEEIGDVIKAFGTPAILVRGGKAETNSKHWNNFLTSELEAAIPAVGRLRMLYTKDTYLGTSWFVENRIAVTARHVAVKFAQKSGDKFEFLVNDQGVATGADMNTSAEVDASTETVFIIKRVIYIDPTLDVAFLEMDGNNLPKAIPLEAKSPAKNEVAAVIGHPLRFEGFTNAELAKKVFENIFEVKRVMIGEIRSLLTAYVTHSCPTLGGCSGAPLISVETGKAVGLHVGGNYNKVNFAIPAIEIIKLLDKVRNM